MRVYSNRHNMESAAISKQQQQQARPPQPAYYDVKDVSFILCGAIIVDAFIVDADFGALRSDYRSASGQPVCSAVCLDDTAQNCLDDL